MSQHLIAHTVGLDSDQMDHFIAYSRFVEFFCRQFKNPNLVDGVDCRQSYKDYIFKYFRKAFTVPDGLTSRHVKSFRRLLPVLALPAGSRVVDYGGGYGIDTIYLASRGFRMSLLEIPPHHLAICRHLASRYNEAAGPLDIEYLLGDRTYGTMPDHPVDAVLLNEVAHHLEPPEKLFAHCARMLGPVGRLFLLEPNSWNVLTQAYFFRVRGFQTVGEIRDELTGKSYVYGKEHIRSRGRWTRLATAAGFHLAQANYISSYFQPSGSFRPGLFRTVVESIPGLRSVLASHVSYSFICGAPCTEPQYADGRAAAAAPMFAS